MDIIKQNCDFIFYYNKSDITPTVLDGGNEINLANWPNDKHTICIFNNDIPIKIPSHPYVLVKRSVLWNCRIEVENNFLLESLAACTNGNTKLVMYFTMTIPFTNYINQFNLTEELEAPIHTNKTTLEYTSPVISNKSMFDDALLSVPWRLKEYINQYKHDSEIFDLKERHDMDELDIEFANKKFFTSNFIVDIFVFVIAIISVINTIIIIYVLCKHNKLRVLVKKIKRNQVQSQIDYNLLKDNTYKRRYNILVKNYYDVLGSEKVEQDHESEEEHVEKEWSKVKLSLQNAAKELVPKKMKKKKRGWMNDKIYQKMEQRKSVKNKTTECNVINKEIVDECRQAKDNWLNEQCE